MLPFDDVIVCLFTFIANSAVVAMDYMQIIHGAPFINKDQINQHRDLGMDK